MQFLWYFKSDSGCTCAQITLRIIKQIERNKYEPKNIPLGQSLCCDKQEALTSSKCLLQIVAVRNVPCAGRAVNKYAIFFSQLVLFSCDLPTVLHFLVWSVKNRVKQLRRALFHRAPGISFPSASWWYPNNSSPSLKHISNICQN